MKHINQKTFEKLIKKLAPHGASVSAQIINLDTDEILSVNPNRFIYPASTYKIFIGAEVLRQVESGTISLTDKITIKYPNDIDNEARFYPTDVYPVLKSGDIVDIDTLLKLMLQRSDNTASNALIDLVGREDITQNIVHANNWHGSEVTRKFLNRIYEKKTYRHADITVASGRHLSEFMQMTDNNTLVSPFVSERLKEYMSINMRIYGDTNKRLKQKMLGFAEYAKPGWIEARSTRLPKILRRFYNIRYQSQAAVVKTKNGRFAIGILAQYGTIFPKRYFKFSKITDWLNG